MRLWANNAGATLAAGITAGATSLTVSAGQGERFPALANGHYFVATLTQPTTETSWEEVKVTARVGDTLTIERGYEGSTASAWAAGDSCDLRVTASFLEEVGGVLPVTAPSNFTAKPGVHYLLSGASAITCTLPSDPTEGDTIIITIANNRVDNAIDAGAASIVGPADSGFGPRTLDFQNASLTLRFLNAAWRLI